MVLFINCSPKLNFSNSKYFCDLLKIDNRTNYIYKDDFKDIIKNIDIYDTIIFSIPTYLDIIPSKLIEFIENNNINFKNKNIYLICNCGFMEYYHNNLVIEFIKNYICSNNGNFKGFLNIGAGEVIKLTKNIKPLKLICISFYIKLNKFRKVVLNKKEAFFNTSINFVTKKMYCNICNHYWRKKLN